MGYKIRRQIRASAGAEFGNADQVALSHKGRLTLAGSARFLRDIWLPAPLWVGIEPDQIANAFNATTANASAIHTARAMDFGNAAGSTVQVPILAASTPGASLNARAATVVFTPPDAATTGSVEAWVYYTTKLAMASAGSKQVFRMHSIQLGVGGSALGTLTPGASVVKALAMSTIGNGKLEAGSIGLLPSFSHASPMMFLQLTVECSNAASGMPPALAASAEEQIFGVRLQYLADSLGIVS